MKSSVQTVMSDGVLGPLGATTKSIATNGFPIPCTLMLKSADVSRKIELSIDGLEFWTPTYDVSTATMLITSIKAPVQLVRFTGLATDTYGVN